MADSSRLARLHAPAIYYFDAVRRAGSIRGAARMLNVAASAVNRQILNLEEDLGSPLFERMASGLRLTATGESFARHALTVLQDQERLRVELQGLATGWIGTVRIAGIEALNMSFLPELIRRYRALAPRVGFAVTTMGSFEVQAALVNGACDVGIAFALRHSPELRQVALARFRLGAIVAAGHPLAGHTSLTLAGCVGTPMILATAELSIRQLLEPSLARLPHLPEPAVQSNSIELMRECARRGVGVSFGTRLGMEQPLTEQRLVFVPLVADGGPVWSDLGVYIRNSQVLPAHLDRFLQELVADMRLLEGADSSAL